MSVYTSLSSEQIEQLLLTFDLGLLQSFQGIASGMENTNYFVNTSAQPLVLTLFEHHPAAEVEQFVAFARHLGNSSSVPVPAPVADRHGRWLHEVAGKPAILCPRLPGRHIDVPGPVHCQQIGAALAQLHLAGASLDLERPNERGLAWWQTMPAQVASQIDDERMQVLQQEIAHQLAIQPDWQQLPRGWIHGDMFHDNALFSGSEQQPQLGAILDLYNACQDVWIYDLAIVANDWCCKSDGSWKEAELLALLVGYQSVRPLTTAEQHYWPDALRAAALRFWLSRLLTRQIQARQVRPGDSSQLALTKDPDEFYRKLKLRVQPHP